MTSPGGTVTDPLITLTVGPRNAHTNSETGLRYYRWKGVEYPSVTTIRRMAGLPFGLHNWAINQVVDRAINAYPDLGRMIGTGSPEQIKATKTWLRKAATEERDRAASLGTRVHDAAAESRAVVDVGAELAPFLRQFQDWLAKSGFDIILTERQAWNLTLGYAGTFDFIARDRNGVLWLVDLKTGKGTYTDHAIQLIGYAMSEFVGEDDVIDQQASDLLAEASRMALLHLRPEGWAFKEIVVTPRLFRAFEGLLAFATFASEHQYIDGLIKAERKGVAP